MPEPTGQIENAGPNEKTGSPKSYFEIIKGANTYDTDWLGNPELQQRQASILSELPGIGELSKDLARHIKKERDNENYHAQRQGRKPKHSPVRSLSRGWLHENLVSIENKLYISKERAQLNVEHTDRWADPELEDAITQVLKDPPFGSLINKRKPDLSYVEARQGNLVVITGTGEAKAARKLDRRAFNQLSSGGFRRTLEKLVPEVNDLTRLEAEQRGLKGLGKGGMTGASFNVLPSMYICAEMSI